MACSNWRFIFVYHWASQMWATGSISQQVTTTLGLGLQFRRIRGQEYPPFILLDIFKNLFFGANFGRVSRSKNYIHLALYDNICPWMWVYIYVHIHTLLSAFSKQLLYISLLKSVTTQQLMKYVLSISTVLCYMFRLLEAITRQIHN
jgi:hypothetical protein